MTSMPVTNIANSYMNVTTSGTENAGKSDAFSNIYDTAKTKVQTDKNSDTSKRTEDMKPERTEKRQEVTEDTSVREEKTNPTEQPDATTEKTVDAKTDVSDKQDTETTPEEILEELMTLLTQTTLELLNTVAEELGIEVEDVTELLGEMNLTPEDLFTPENLTNVIMQANEETDPMALTTDEKLYEQLKVLTQAAEEINTNLAEETGMTVETLTERVEALTEQVRVLNNQEAPKQIAEEKEVPQNTTETITTEPIRENQVQGRTENTQNDSTSEKQEEQDETKGNENLTNPFLNTLEANGTVNGEAPVQYTTGTDMADGIDIIRQITEHMSLQQKEDLTQLELQLQPATLGTIHMTISSKEGMITANIQTQNEAVKNALESQVMMLRENLEAQGVRVEAIEVTVASHEFERNLEQNGEREKQEFENAQKATGKRRTLRQINLNDETEDEMSEEEALDDEIRIAREMMKANGNTVDYTA